MECTLATLIACFSWSGLYLDTGLAYKENSEHYMLIERTVIRSDLGTVTEEGERTFQSSAARSVHGHFAIGYEVRFESLSINLEALSHDSRLDSSRDRGENAYRLNVRWFPFR